MLFSFNLHAYARSFEGVWRFTLSPKPSQLSMAKFTATNIQICHIKTELVESSKFLEILHIEYFLKHTI